MKSRGRSPQFFFDVVRYRKARKGKSAVVKDSGLAVVQQKCAVAGMRTYVCYLDIHSGIIALNTEDFKGDPFFSARANHFAADVENFIYIISP